MGLSGFSGAVDAPCAVPTFSEVPTRIRWRCDEHYGMKFQPALGNGSLVAADKVTLMLDRSATEHA